MDLAYTMDWT